MDSPGERAAPTSPERKLQELVQNLDAIVWEANPQTLRFSFVSKRAEDILGYPVERWSEPGFFAGRIHPEDRDETINSYRTAVREGNDHSFEYRVVAADGRIVWLRDRVQVGRDSRGRPMSLRGVMVDITPRKRAEQGLRESEDRYRQLVHRSPDAIMVHSEGRIVYANVAAAELLGAGSPDELLGLQALSIVHPDYHEIVKQRIRSEEQGQAVEMIDEQFIRLDGSIVDVEVSGIPFTYKGKPAGQIVVRDITERKRTENQLRETEARYRALVESISAVLYIELPDTGSNTLYISPQIETVIGLKPDEYLADPEHWEKHLHPDDRDRTVKEYQSFIGTGQPEVSEYRMIAADGRVVWIHDRSMLLRDETGKPELVQGVMIDITEQKLAEERLRRRDAILEAVDLAAERFLGAPRWEDTIDDVLRALGEAAGAHRVYIFQKYRDEHGVLRGSQLHEWAARGIPRFVGDPEYTNVPLIEQGWARWVDILDSDGVVHGPVRDFPEAERTLLEKAGVKSLMDVPIFVDQERWGSIGIDDCVDEREWSVAEIDALRAAAGTLGAAIQRQHTEAELREAEAKFRALVEHIPAVLYVDQPGTEDITTYISPQLESLFGLSAEEWIEDPKLWYNHLHPDDRDRAYETYHRGIASGQPFSYEYRLVTPSGVMWIRDDAVVLQTESDKPIVQGVMFDITEQKLAEQALLESETREREAAQSLRTLNEMKNTFLAAVSHELRSPLTAVLGLSLTLEQQELSGDERNDLLRRLATNARKLEKLLADLLDIDRLSRGVIQPQRHRTDIGAVVRRAVEASDYLDGREVHVETESVIGSVDSAKVERIVENLLVNAARHTTPETNVWVKTFPRDGGVVIAVEDDGPGIPTELREEIFEPFRQGPTPSSHAPGTGIGLSLVLRFAELHGGRAWVEDRPGGGSSFRVFLPTGEGGPAASAG